MKSFLISLLIFFVLFLKYSSAQKNSVKDTFIVTRTVIVNGDTIPNVSIEEVVIFPKLVFKNKYRERRYSKLVRDVKRAYPYAIYAKKKLDEMESEFQGLKTEKERKKYVKTIEKQLMDEFGNELKHLTITQGRILLKLIDRETGDTSYELLKDLRGAVSAVFWQTIARIFGSDLKSQYDPRGDDALIERVVRLIETGQITLDQQVVERLKMSY
ncbi:MAG TPA: DUF4294 domain-containing protein [Bacteroidales bacterium]|jgi:hypothetical protein|nr:DUF4294 domain-containing protein [Bacteroidales bacterium]